MGSPAWSDKLVDWLDWLLVFFMCCNWPGVHAKAF